MDFGFQMFNIVSIIVPVFFVVFTVMFVIGFAKALKKQRQDKKAPRLTVPATVVAKRTKITRNVGEHYQDATTYYATFQVESGDRMELRLNGYEYGMIVEGDRGKLTFQGSKFLSFERT